LLHPSVVADSPARSLYFNFGIQAYTYDVAGRIVTSTQVTGGTSYPFAYAYNQAGLLERTTLPSGRSVTQCYDKAGRVKSVEGAKPGGQPHAYLSQAAYHEGGGLQQALLGNGRWEGWDYNTRMQPTQVKLGTTKGAADLLSLTFGYGPAANNNGNILSQTIARPTANFNSTETYTYDPLNRLKTGGGTGWAQTYVFDRYGNRAILGSSTILDAVQSPVVSDETEAAVQTIFPGNRWTGGTYDLAGNQLSRYAGSFTYDAEGRLKTSTINTATTTFEYDGEGRRVKKGNEIYVYDAFGNLAAEYGGTVSTAGTQYLTADHLGSTRLITNTANPAEPRCIDYFPFGEEIPRPSVACYTPTTEPRQKFTGKERDAETGLDYFGARYMSAAQGRFTSPDWSETPQPVPYADLADPQTLNLYAYARNNPLNRVDPDGHFWHIVAGAGGGYAVGAGMELGRQWLKGETTDLQKANAKGVNGAIFGGTVAATGGLSLMATAGAYTAATVVGGATERAIDGDATTKVLDKKAVTADVLVGTATGIIGGAAKELAKETIAAGSKQATTRAESLLNQAIASGNPAKIAKREVQQQAVQQEISNSAAAAASAQRTAVRAGTRAVLKPDEEK
jgi:RHS repeat-associated protein